MKIRKLLSLTVALCLALLPVSAMAGAELTGQQSVDSFTSMSNVTNTYYGRGNGGYVLYNAEGQAISAAYGDISTLYASPYYQVNNGAGLNGLGVIDSTGKEIVPLSYGDIEVYGDHWIMGIVLEPTTAEKGDYHDSKQNQYNIASVDAYFDGVKVGTLTRDEYPQNYSASEHGDYLYLKLKNDEALYISPAFEKTTFTDEYVYTTLEYDEVYGKGVFHRPTNQQVFVPGCTLTPDQVDQAVWYNDNGDFIDLQGNVISQGASPYKEYDSVRYDSKEYLRVSVYHEGGSKYGLVNAQGEEVLFPQYDELGGSGEDVYFAVGYQAVLENGALKYLDQAGNVTAATSYNMDASSYKGFYNNAPMVAIENLGQVIVVTATAGELPQRYEDYRTCEAYQRVMAVELNGKWGVIDMNGETIVPFECKYSPDISHDGTLVVGRTESGYVRYTIAYTEEAPAEPAAEADAPTEPAADDGWVCPTCGQTVTTNFCPNDGTARPAKVACPNCGYEPADGIMPNFCPNCGAKLQ